MCSIGGQNGGNSSGEDLGEFKGYLGVMFGNASLTKIAGKAQKTKEKPRKT